MTNKTIQFLLQHFPAIVEKAHAEIQEIENSMVGAKGIEKKAELDKRIIEFSSTLIRNFDIPQVPNIIENNILDPATIKLIEMYLPPITQSVYNASLVGLQKLDKALS